MAPFGIGLIGAGRMGRTHLRALAGSGRVRVTAVAEMSAAACEAVAAPGMTLHETVTDMLDHAELVGGRGDEHPVQHRVIQHLRHALVQRHPGCGHCLTGGRRHLRDGGHSYSV